MSHIILTEGDVELLPDASYLGSFAEDVLTLLLQLSLRQRQISTGNDRHGQFLDGSLKRVQHRRHVGCAGLPDDVLRLLICRFA